MSDPAIKLFGKTIALPLPAEDGGGDDIIHKGSPTKEIIITETKEDRDGEIEPGNSEPLTSTGHEHDDKETTPDGDTSAEEQQSDSTEKPLKKPDKILPCPRCKSMDTKFCYYNNYNVNQPRHFCKNCQRYWTAGGTMRNVPVGAGRRKNKNSNHYPTLKTNGTVLSFGSNACLGDMMDANKMAEKSTGSSIDEGIASNLQGFAPHFAWPYLWTPPFSPPAAYWGCSSWSVPWISLGSGPRSPTLGKHSRDNDSSKQSNLWIPKTSRIGDPEAAARCSIWATMGFKNDKADCGGLFREFDGHKVEANSQVLFANPAALSRSINFQETS